MSGPGRHATDETGNIYGRLTVLERASNVPGEPARWLCGCTCGNRTIARGRDLRRGDTRSCGCLRVETMAKGRGPGRGFTAQTARTAGRSGGLARIAKHGPPMAGVRGADNPLWKGGAVGYRGAHARVERLRGSAKAHTCARCGHGHDKMEWAYNGADPNERYGNPFARTLAYSPNPAFYEPLCETCHIIVDVARGGRVAARSV